MTILIWALAVAGSALIITQSGIVAPLRDWLESKADGAKKAENMWPLPYASWLSKLAHCPMCSGFWIGAFWTRVLLASPWVDSTHPRASIALWLFVGGCAGSVVSAVGVATWLFLDEAKMAIGLWRYLKTPKEEPAAPSVRVPRYMRAGLVNGTDSPIKCPCGVVIQTDLRAHHRVSQHCGVLRGRNLTPLAGTIAIFANPHNEVVTCGCGATVVPGETHALTDACDGTTSLDI